MVLLVWIFGNPKNVELAIFIKRTQESCTLYLLNQVVNNKIFLSGVRLIKYYMKGSEL